MSPPSGDYEGERFSGNEIDDDDDLNIQGLDDIRRACMPSSMDADDDLNRPSTSAAECSGGATVAVSGHVDDDGADDFELARNIMNRYSGDVGDGALCAVTDSDDELADRELLQSIEKKYSVRLDMSRPISSKPISSIPPAVVDDDEDDFETLRAIEKRFRAYDIDKAENPWKEPVSDASYEEEISDRLLCSNVHDIADAGRSTVLLEETAETRETHASSHLPRTRSQFPLAAQFIIDAIKKNRFSQKFLRTKLIQMESKIEENKELKKRLEALKDFQTLCRKRTGHALSLKKDPRVQLISVKKINNKKASVMHFGPEENAHVANYKRVLESFPISFVRKKWSKEEKENLAKGIRQEFQEMLTQVSMNMFSSDGSSLDICDFDNILASIKDFEITPEHIREFLPKVNWDKLASKYVVGRSGAECEARWLNCEDPLINSGTWNTEEDRTLLDIVSRKGPRNWFDIAESLSTDRTPFQCLLRYQRSLNPSMLNKEWTEEEDDKLRAAVERFGENDWQSVASAVENRTGAQCSNRWKKSLCPQRKGSFSADEDKRLKIGIMFFGQKWEKIALYIPGRTGAQCRDRYVNSLNPELKWDAWSEEEDAKLIAALEKHKFCWSKIAKEVDKRTDGQCRKRWMKLFPEDVPKLQEAKKRQKTALISNFVDREAERPAFSLDSFLPSPMLCSAPESDNLCKRRKRNISKVTRVRKEQCDKQAQNVLKKTRTRGRKKCNENYSGDQHVVTSNENYPCNDASVVPYSGNNLILAVPDSCLVPPDAALVNDQLAQNVLKKIRPRKRKKHDENYVGEQHVVTANENYPCNDAPVIDDAVGRLSGTNSIIAIPDNCLVSPDAALVNDQQAQNVLKKTRTRKRKKHDENYAGEHHVTSNENDPYNDSPVIDNAVGRHSGNNSIISIPYNCLVPQDAALVKDKKQISKSGSRDKKKTSNSESRKKKSTELTSVSCGSLLSSNPEPEATNGVYMEPSYRNNIAEEREEGAYKDNCQEKQWTKETFENSLQLTESVRGSNLQFQNDQISCLDATNEEEDISNVLEVTLGEEGFWQRQNAHMVMVNSGSDVFSSRTELSEVRIADDVQNNFLERNISEEYEVFNVGREQGVTGAMEKQCCEPMHSEAQLEILSEKTQETPVGDDVSLACFLQNRPKKKRVKLFDNYAQAGHQMQFGTRHHVSPTFCLNESLDSICEPSGLKQSNNGKPLLSEQEAVNMGIDSENGELPLVYLLGSKLKKRLQAYRKGRRPSSRKRSGLLADAEVQCNGDNSITFSQSAKENKGYHGKIPTMSQVQNHECNSPSSMIACDSDKNETMSVKKNYAIQRETVEELGADLRVATASFITYHRRGKVRRNGI